MYALPSGIYTNINNLTRYPNGCCFLVPLKGITNLAQPLVLKSGDPLLKCTNAISLVKTMRMNPESTMNTPISNTALSLSPR